MRVLLGLCCCLAVASAGFFGYPRLPFGYDGRFTYSINQPVTSFTTVSQPFPTTLNGICDPSLNLNPPLFPQQLFLPNVIVQGPPGFVQILPFPPANNNTQAGNGNGGSNGTGNEGNDTTEETTQTPSTEVENGTNGTNGTVNF